jgi:hypothetical protein
VIALKAMGMECDQEIVQFVGTEPDIMDLFSGSLEEPYNLGIFTQEQVTICCTNLYLLLTFPSLSRL